MTDFENKPLENAENTTEENAVNEATPASAEAVQETPAAQESPAAAPVTADPFEMPPVPQAPNPPERVYSSPFDPPQYGSQYTEQQYEPQYAPPPQYQPQGYYQQKSVHPAMQHIFTPPAGYPQKSRLAAALLAMTVGVFGCHNFYLGFKSKAVIQLCVSIVFCWLIFPFIGMWVWAFVEGILLLIGDGSRRFDGNGVIMKE